ncbi:MAG TPA: Rid family detoxifying hydrolase [Solirubrobacterales bacterium]|nr:Rid family detoxifying hydrolase [Solirubrobacterales bacterium]
MTPSSASETSRTPILAPDAPAAIGPYSHAVSHGDLLFCSGALPLDAVTEELVNESVGAETAKCLENLAAICRSAGTELSNAVRMTIYTTDLDSFAEINEAYGSFFPEAPPARAAIGVAALPKGAKVEIDAVVAVR